MHLIGNSVYRNIVPPPIAIEQKAGLYNNGHNDNKINGSSTIQERQQFFFHYDCPPLCDHGDTEFFFSLCFSSAPSAQGDVIFRVTPSV